MGSVSIKTKARLGREVAIKEIESQGHKADFFVVSDEYLKGHTWEGFYSDLRARELKLHKYTNINLLSAHGDEKTKPMLEEPVGLVNRYVRQKIRLILGSDEFLRELKKLEDSMNTKLATFLGQTDKRLEISFDNENLHEALTLYDRNDVITPEQISDGERVLLNLVYSFSNAKLESYDIIGFDEPDLYMHDDMVQVLVKELDNLVKDLPKSILIVATHSAGFIERLAKLGEGKVNLILFDEKKQVYNSKNDLDFINALNRNGVWFSPLMLSKKPNIFIENQGRQGKEYRDFYLKFFEDTHRPNVIPIGSGASVEQSDSFADVLKELVKASDINSIGLRDGDHWIRQALCNYLGGNIKLETLLELIDGQPYFYITEKSKRKKAVTYYFNCWEMENLFFMEDLLRCWRQNNKFLTKRTFIRYLRSKKELLSKQFLEVYYKTLYPRPSKAHTLEMKAKTLRKAAEDAKELLNVEKDITTKADRLVSSLITKNLIHWLPGKEIKLELSRDGYVFDDSQVNYSSLQIVDKVREVLKLG